MRRFSLCFLLSRPNEPDTVLAPDLAFIPAARTPEPGSPDWRGFPRLAPDLVVEIASPRQSRPDLTVKARLWLRVGVQLVWVVWPAAHQVLGLADGVRLVDAVPGAEPGDGHQQVARDAQHAHIAAVGVDDA